MIPHQPLYYDILNQPVAYKQSLRHHTGAGLAELEQAADLIRRAEQIVVVAIGASYSAAIPFVYRLAEVGQRVILEDAAEFLHYTHRAYNDDTVYLLISRSGDTIEIVRALELLKDQRRFTIGITNVADSRLALEAELPLLMDSPADVMIAIQTYLTTVLTLHLLAELAIGPESQELIFDEAAWLAGPLRQTIETYQDRSRTWAADFELNQAIYLLARGASLASSTQGALLLHEMSRFPGVAAYSAGHFRHGPWEVMDERIRSFVFAPEDNTYGLNIALALDLHRFGSDVTLITSRAPKDAPEALAIWPIPATSSHVAPLLEIVPIQFFAYEFACWQNLSPGSFRACTPITLTEGGELVDRHLIKVDGSNR